MPTIKNVQGDQIFTLFEEIYELTADSGDPNYTTGELVRLISGVDDSPVLGYHFNKDFRTVCSVAALRAQHVGVRFKYLKKVS